MLLPAAKRAKFSSIPTALMMLSSSLTQHQLPVLRSIRETQVLSAMPAAPIDKTLTKVIGTHDGSFHCDEALAISMLKCLPEYESALVIRTRDPALLAQCSIVVDVGAVYNEAENRFDHHQREFQGTLDNYKTRLSSAGLVYKHFGKRILRSVLEWDAPASSVPEAFVDICYDKVYRNFIEHIDAIDNGISVADGELRYRISSTLSNRVGTLNPAWNEPQGAEVFNARFMDAMQLTVSEFCESAIGLWKYWWPARSIVQAAVDKRFEAHPSGKIIVLDQFCPWKDHLFEIEETVCCVLHGAMRYNNIYI